MTSPFRLLGRSSLATLADDLDQGRLRSPVSAFALGNRVPPAQGEVVAREIQRLFDLGMQQSHIALLVRMLGEEREDMHRRQDEIELVWTGPEGPGAASRDTYVVVRDLFSTATRSVLVAGYAIAQGKQVFEELASRMDTLPDLHVRMFINIIRSHGDPRPDDELVREFSDRFRTDHWPGKRMPEVYYDPRALSRDPGPRSCLHAKCVVVDERRALVTSANFTKAAHERNIEAGVLIERPSFAQALSSQFDSLVHARSLLPLHGLG